MRKLLITGLAWLSRALPGLRGRGRIALVLQRQVRPLEGSWNIPMRAGHRMETPANSAQSWRAAFTGRYDDEEIELLRPYVETASLVIDVGASLGFYTVPLGMIAQACGAHLLAIEPVTANCTTLLRNLELNGLVDTVSIIPLALGREHAKVVLHVETGGTGNASIVTGLDKIEVARHDKVGGTGATEATQVCPLDELDMPSEWTPLRCSLIKIDAEGFEMDILAGSSSFIAANRPVIFAEFSPEWLRTRGESASAPQDWAGEHGYHCMELTYRRPNAMFEHQQVSFRPLAAEEARSGTNLLLVPQ